MLKVAATIPTTNAKPAKSAALPPPAAIAVFSSRDGNQAGHHCPVQQRTNHDCTDLDRAGAVAISYEQSDRSQDHEDEDRHGHDFQASPEQD